MWNSALYVCWLHYGAVKQICLGSMLNVQFVKYTYLWSMVCSSILPSPLWNIMKSIVVSEDIFVSLPSSLYQFVSPFCQNAKSTLLNCQIHVVMSTLPRFQLYIVNKATLQNCHHPLDCPKWASICPQFKKFWAVKRLIFFWSSQSPAPKN
jgi:hypothetical protein